MLTIVFYLALPGSILFAIATSMNFAAYYVAGFRRPASRIRELAIVLTALSLPFVIFETYRMLMR